MDSIGYAVIDVETTGLDVHGQDRIVELAVVHADPDGTVTDRWQTLINPGCELGSDGPHGICGDDVRDAPRFEQIADDLRDLLHERTIVAHDAIFGTGFLAAEWSRAGCLEEHEFPARPVCTMRLASRLAPCSGGNLSACCEAFDIELGAEHGALADADATARLLAACMRAEERPRLWARSLMTPFLADAIGRTGQRAAWQPRQPECERAADAVLREDEAASWAQGPRPLRAGDQLVLSGELRRSRQEWRERLRAAGCVLRPAISRKTAVLVAAEAAARSYEAQAAREYGIPILSEEWLIEQLG